MRHAAASMFAVALAAAAPPAPAQGPESGYWRASSRTATSITGDVAFSNDKFTMNFFTTAAADIRELKPGEVSAMFDVDASTAGKGTLYRVDIPGMKTFLHKNKLCGGEDTQWLAIYASGRDLQMALFSGDSMPVFTIDAISNASNLCGTFSYVR
jgi:hypothetical protein